ncbi:hypothetical protein F157LOC_00746 [Pectobacterium brasiliense]|uniref:ECs1072 family phage-associated protein n=1 Tax=Pectobacterium brasiliense TaxID=180957 RepID=UPI000CE68906|nr:hypothetical protein [Pectobacterium brasiliense]PPE61912.1 hypothetical protein F157LOC_00746 [Pectobacterium brasiliense]
MSYISNLWEAISIDISKRYNIPNADFFSKIEFDNESVSNARSHAYFILLLELTLQAHRNKYATPFETLSGVAALHHKIFLKTKWHPKTIKDLDYQECLFVLLDDLRLENLPEKYQEFLKILEIQKSSSELMRPLLEGWTPEKFEHYVSRIAL